jgi:glutaredoxin
MKEVTFMVTSEDCEGCKKPKYELKANNKEYTEIELKNLTTQETKFIFKLVTRMMNDGKNIKNTGIINLPIIFKAKLYDNYMEYINNE